MAYIPWWQRRLAPTLAERFELGGLAGRIGFSEGSDADRYNKVRPMNCWRIRPLIWNCYDRDNVP